MNNNEKLIIKKDISEIRSLYLDEIISMCKYTLDTYINCIIVFGINHKVSKNCISILKEFFNILLIENKLLGKISRYSELEDYEEVNDFIDKLDDVNDKTISFYYECLEDIEDACSTKQEWRANRRRKSFDSLIESDEYSDEAVGLILNMDDVKKFLNYPADFWEYIKSRTIILDDKEERDKEYKLYGVNPFEDKDGNIKDFRIFVPKIINLRTALINIHEFKHAFDLYSTMKDTFDTLKYENDAKEKEKEFIKNYLVEKKKNY